MHKCADEHELLSPTQSYNVNLICPVLLLLHVSASSPSFPSSVMLILLPVHTTSLNSEAKFIQCRFFSWVAMIRADVAIPAFGPDLHMRTEV